MGITWIDVRGQIPQPFIAEDAVEGSRRVEARLWHTPADPTPYTVEIRLLENEALVERWTAVYKPGPGFNHAVSTYYEGKGAAERWLGGATLAQARPRYKWGIHRP